MLGRLSIAGLHNVLEKNICWKAAELFQGQGAGEDSKEEFQNGKANSFTKITKTARLAYFERLWLLWLAPISTTKIFPQEAVEKCLLFALW